MIWFDVGAHKGQGTLWPARLKPFLRVYAFEPNTKLAEALARKAPRNYEVYAIAVSDVNDISNFYINREDGCSSLLELGKTLDWQGGENLRTISVVKVRTSRLDTLMDSLQVGHIDWLKVDTQGNDLKVVMSAGNYLRYIRKITLETILKPLYLGQASKTETLDYVLSNGFKLVRTKPISFSQAENLEFIRK